jgi:amino-acid N-acetyltransferase
LKQSRQKEGIGHKILEKIIERAREVGVNRIFCLTFQTEFFGRHGFEEIQGTPVDPDVYQQLLRSYDAGVAEFLDLESVKPNTLGNTRMLLNL